MNPPSLPNELPREIRDQLDPQLANLCCRLPPVLSEPIAGLVNKALKLGIHPDRLVKYAFLRATAEREAQGDAVSMEHAIRSKTELVGELHGLPTGYRDDAEASGQYRRGRRARQQIAASLEGLLTRWRAFEAVLEKHGGELPAHLQPQFSHENLAGTRELLRGMQSVLTLGSDALSEKNRPRALSAGAQTYIWWRFVMARYRGKWNDMHQLARVWRLSDAKDVETFRSMVVRITRDVTEIHYPFGSAWDSVFEKA